MPAAREEKRLGLRHCQHQARGGEGCQAAVQTACCGVMHELAVWIASPAGLSITALTHGGGNGLPPPLGTD